jgi:hypothetical protein
MLTKLVVITILFLSVFTFQCPVNAQNISAAEANRLIAFLKEKMGSFVPPDAKIEVMGYQATPVKGFKQGKISITTSKGSGDVPYLISDDKKYLIFGEPVDTQKFLASPYGLKQGKVQIGAGPPIPVLLTSDGRYLVIGGELIEYKSTTADR